MISDISQVFTSFSLHQDGYVYLSIELNPDVIWNTEIHRYKTGFAITDMPCNTWPSPWRNLNNTGKVIIPNYGYPSLPETVGEFVLRLQLDEENETNTLKFMLPGVIEAESVGLSVCFINPDDYWLGEPTAIFMPQLTIE